MSEVLAFPVIESQPVDADLLIMALELVRDVRAGKIAGFAYVAIYPDDDAVMSRWASGLCSTTEIASAVSALAHDLFASRAEN